MKDLKYSHPLILVIFLGLSLNCFAKNDSISKYSLPWEKFSIDIGGYAASINSNLRLGNETFGLGLDINLEDALGLNTRSATWRTQMLYRFSKNRKHAAKVCYFQIYRRASRDINSELQVGNTTFEESRNVSTKFKLEVLQINYCYSFLLDDRLNFFGSIGFYMMPTEFAFGQDGSITEQTDFIAPLPALGLGMDFYLSRYFLLRHSTNFFYLQFENYKGNMIDLGLFIEYQPKKNIGIGLGYNSFHIDLEVERSSIIGNSEFIGKVGYEHSGLLFYTKVMF